MTPANPDMLPIDLTDLMNEIDRLPEEHRQNLIQPLNRVVEYTRRRRRILNLIPRGIESVANGHEISHVRSRSDPS